MIRRGLAAFLVAAMVLTNTNIVEAAPLVNELIAQTVAEETETTGTEVSDGDIVVGIPTESPEVLGTSVPTTTPIVKELFMPTEVPMQQESKEQLFYGEMIETLLAATTDEERPTMYDAFLAEAWMANRDFNRLMGYVGNYEYDWFGAMPYRSIVWGLNFNHDFQGDLFQWETTMAVFGTSGNTFEKQDFYDRVAYSVIVHYYENKLDANSEEMEENVENCYIDLTLFISEYVEEKYDMTLEEYKELILESIDFTADTLESSLDIAELVAELQGLEAFDDLGASKIFDFLEMCSTLDDFMDKTSVVMYLSKTAGELSELLLAASERTNNEALKASLNNIAACCSNEVTMEIYNSIYSGTTGDGLLKDQVVDGVKAGISSLYVPYKAAMITADVTDSLFNCCFSHNEAVECYYYMNALCDFEAAIRNVWEQYKSDYWNYYAGKNEKKMAVAGKKLCQATNLMLSTFDIGLASAEDYIKYTATGNKFLNFWGIKTEGTKRYEEYVSDSQIFRGQIKALMDRAKREATCEYENYLLEKTKSSTKKSYQSVITQCELAPEEVLYDGDPEQDYQEMQEYLNKYSNIYINGNLTLNADLELGGSLIMESGTLNLNGHTLTLGGGVEIYGGTLYINGGTLNVAGDFNIGTKGEIDEETGYRLATSTGKLRMENAADEVIVGGDFVTCSNVSGTLNDGMLRIGGNFAQYGTYSNGTSSSNGGSYAWQYTFPSTSAHKVEFTEDKAHSIYFDSTGSGFNQVDFGNGEIEILSTIRGFALHEDAEWNLKLEEDKLGIFGTLDLNGHKLIINNDVNVTSGSLMINGGSLELKGNLSFGTKGEIDEEKGYRLATSTGKLMMDKETDEVSVEGDFETCSNVSSTLSKGTLRIGGNLAQYGTFYNGTYSSSGGNYAWRYTFPSTSAHKVEFTEDKAHSIYFDSTGSGFNQVDFGNGEIEILSAIRGFVLYEDTEWNLKLEEDKFGISGTLDLAGHTLTINGNMNLTSGTIDINEGCLTVKGDLSLGTKGELSASGTRLSTSSGKLVMDGEADEVIVEGSYETCSSYPSTLTAGTLHIGGDFAQYASNYGYQGGEYAYRCNFDASGSHKIEFDKDKAHAIYFDITTSGFNQVDFGNGEIEILSAIRGFALYEDTEWNLKLKEDKLGISGALDLAGHTLTINGNMNLTSGTIDINEGCLTVKGDLSLGTKGELSASGTRLSTSSGKLVMDGEADEVIVEGSYETCSSYPSTLTAGTLHIGGDFAQYASNYGYQGGEYAYRCNFDASGSHTVVLCGAKPQSIFFEYSGSNFNRLVCTNPMSSYTFSPEKCWHVLIDGAAPIMIVTEPSVEAETLTDTEATFTAEVNETSKVGVYWVPLENAVTYTAEQVKALIIEWKNAEAEAKVNITAKNLTPNTEYGYIIVSYDESGNIAVYADAVEGTNTYKVKTFTTKKTMPVFEEIPSISGIYGETLSEMTLFGLTTSLNGVNGIWSLSDKNKTVVPEVAGENSFEVTFTPTGENAEQFETLVVDVIPTVAKREITITINDAIKTEGEENPEFTYEITEGELVNADTFVALNIQMTTEATKDSAAGIYEITATSDSKNYEVIIINGMLTVEAANTPEKMVKSFVNRMYTVALGREAESGGVDYWAEQLLSYEIDGAGIAGGFILSPEFTGRGYSDTEYIQTLYHTFFDRSADSEGLSYWTVAMNGGQSREYVLAGFVNSNEFNSLCSAFGISRGMMKEDGTAINPGIWRFAGRLYTKVLERGGEKDGIEYWALRIADGICTPEEAAKGFFRSDEYLSKNTSDEKYIQALYATFMDREAEPGGMEYWKNKLAGGTSREEALSGFAQSNEFKGIMAEYGL